MSNTQTGGVHAFKKRAARAAIRAELQGRFRDMHGYDIRTVQQLFGDLDRRTRMIYTYVLNPAGLALRSTPDTAQARGATAILGLAMQIGALILDSGTLLDFALRRLRLSLVVTACPAPD